jgi:FkbM family methyltransferase
MRALLRKLPLLPDLYRNLRIKSGLYVKAQESISGFKFVGNSAQIDETYELQISDFLLEHHQEFDHFINIGANTGYWPVFLRHHGFKAKMTLVEPDHLNLRVLRRNLALNGHQDIEIIEMAAGNFSGEIELHGFGTGVSAIQGWAGGSSKRTQKVGIAPIDEILKSESRHGLLLIDVEGLEIQVLEGAKKLLEFENELLVEIAAFEHQPENVQINPSFFETFSLMRTSGYTAFGWLPTYREVTELDIQSIASKRLDPAIQMYHFKKVVN